jgi:hypothetical protein
LTFNGNNLNSDNNTQSRIASITRDENGTLVEKNDNIQSEINSSPCQQNDLSPYMKDKDPSIVIDDQNQDESLTLNMLNQYSLNP